MGIGLLPPFNLFEGHGWWMTLVIYLLLSPVGMIVVGLVGELRLVPINPQRQFFGLIPGDIFLGLAAATLLVVAQAGSTSDAWYRSPWVHGAVLAITVAVAVVMTIAEIKTGFYPVGAILSPTKLYHNFLLYGGYGYMVVMALVAWAICALWLDTVPGFLGQLPSTEKAHLAHIDQWWMRWPEFWRFLTTY